MKIIYAFCVRTIFPISIAALFFLAFFAASVPAQISITTLNTTYTQNFDGMGVNDLALADDITGSLPGFHALRQIGNTNPNLVTADDGSGTTPGYMNYGQSLQLDRALGMLPGGPTGWMRVGARFVNNTGVPISSIEVTFTGEQWRNSGSQSPQTLIFAYRKDTSVNDLSTGVYTAVPALAFVSPNTGPVAGDVNGNSGANRMTLNATFAVTMAPGEEIMLRWEHLNDFADNHGLSVDDLFVTAAGGSTAAPATISGRVVNASGSGIARTRVVLSGGSLAGPVFALTNPFGYYHFDNVDTGEAYLLRVESKRYRFENPVLFINLGDNMTGADFVANP